MLTIRGCIILSVIAFSQIAHAQEAVTFGKWKAYCAPTAGCALGTTNEDGDKLVISEPPSRDNKMLFIPTVPVQRDSVMTVTLDGQPGATLGPGDGWRFIETSAGPAIQISPTIAREELTPRMRRRDTLEITYTTDTGTNRQTTIPLNGFADTRSYADDG